MNSYDIENFLKAAQEQIPAAANECDIRNITTALVFGLTGKVLPGASGYAEFILELRAEGGFLNLAACEILRIADEARAAIWQEQDAYYGDDPYFSDAQGGF